MQKHCWPEVHKLQNRARHYNLAKPWWDTSLERHLRHGHLRDISINFLCDLYGKKLFPIISPPNIFTHFRDVKQWKKRLKMKKISLKIWKKNPEIRQTLTDESPKYINVYQRLIQKNVFIHEVLTVNQNRRSQHQNISWFWTGKQPNS